MIGPRSVTCISGKWTQPPQCIGENALLKLTLTFATMLLKFRVILENVNLNYNDSQQLLFIIQYVSEEEKHKLEENFMNLSVLILTLFIFTSVKLNLTDIHMIKI